MSEQPDPADQTPPPGVYPDVPADVYRRWKALNKSSLDTLHKRSPKHYIYDLEHPKPPTPALAIGGAFHALALEGELAYAEQVVIGGPINPKTGKSFGNDTNAFAEWAAQFPPGKIFLSGEDDLQIRAMVKALENDQTARQFIEDDKGRNEVSMLWIDEVTGLACKGRMDMDRAVNWGAIGDAKTTEDASPTGFSKSIDEWGYHRQADWYVTGAQQLGLPVRLFAFVCVEKKPPYAVATYQINQCDVEIGHVQNRKLIDTVAECRKNDAWPGYQTEFQTIGMPEWAFRRAIKPQ